MLLITYFREKCIGCAACVEIAPYRWRMSKKDGKSTLIKSTQKNKIQQALVSVDEEKDNRLAAENCPVRIIHIQRQR